MNKLGRVKLFEFLDASRAGTDDVRPVEPVKPGTRKTVRVRPEGFY
ncbi:MAG: hypothetical protein UV20_C0012G0019 [Candidatus Magasanikbacteria bacterium GW2011_GWA2_42_32]|uniref:Uncharacterized protein n=1 Tax=Candidatus Magasanikbacteria bacterium GW2011_GWA2_42_32 TaxID=1619039 RepID=A0A0G1D359_9BACT|nr:MAG: hypothetical protein UV20_C0012G0019 [Candidatus Magasanikbacteria bacterium GW2011_GWA2_42_32]